MARKLTGRRVSGRWLNRLRRDVDESRVLVGPGLEISRGPGGAVLSVPPTAEGGFWAQIIDTPGGKTKYVDARYWVRRLSIATDVSDNTKPVLDQRQWSIDQDIVAVNLAEWDASTGGTHTLSVGTYVYVTQHVDVETQTRHYFFWLRQPWVGEISNQSGANKTCDVAPISGDPKSSSYTVLNSAKVTGVWCPATEFAASGELSGELGLVFHDGHGWVVDWMAVASLTARQALARNHGTVQSYRKA